MTTFTILTLFPEMFTGVLNASMLKRARDKGLIKVDALDIRAFAALPHRQVDDGSYGGGPGMVLRADVLGRALDSLSGGDGEPGGDEPAHRATGTGAVHVIYLSPQGKRFGQEDAQRLAGHDHVVLVCGRYEGIDERFIAARVDEELSLGDFVLCGGEIPAMAVVEAVARLLPGVLGDGESAAADSFAQGLLDHPHYTRPSNWEGLTAPPVLLSGHHGAVAVWRRRQALLRTLIRRPDLIPGACLTREERRILEALAAELSRVEPDTQEPGMA